MDAEIFKNWFFTHFFPEVRKIFRKLKMSTDSKAILYLDNCQAHPPVEVLVSGNISVKYLPPNVISLIQPMDQVVIANFKCFYRSLFLQKLLSLDCNVREFQRLYNLRPPFHF